MSIKYNTRFNPTVSGAEMHAGHLYITLVNATEARASGGKFIVRIDDTQDRWNHALGENLVYQFAEGYIEQLRRFMVIDKWERQSEMPSLRDIVGDQSYFQFIAKPMWDYDQVPEWIADREMIMYPYTPMLTMERVIWDWYEGVNWLIRGEDLITESSLYNYFVDMIRLPRMRQTYLPKLRAEGRKELLALNVSKTLGTYRLSKQIDKLGVEGTLEFLKKSCLIDPDKDFHVDNVKWNPTIVGLVS